ncbi:MAG: N-acetyl-gamma-glutamyl-phosphate reductase [Deltaproteobacteria bacterium]|nr:N-acetyl-gamma-glutamyl-phosphate reductase [Deltaproteobacteria bacterium]
MHRIAVIGASGYTGVELLRLLSRHPETELVCVTSRQYAGQSVAEVFPSLQGSLDLVFENVDPAGLAGRADLVFTAVPHQTAMGMIPGLLDAGCRVVDLSADFRLYDVSVYEAWYQEHSAPELLSEAVYGLPELFREQVPPARLVANPGCYPTSVALALAPLLENSLIDLSTIIVDSKSGASGAGRSAKVDTLYCEVNEGFKAYSLPRHRHTPEIEQTLGTLAGTDVIISFTPHLLPVNRGILSTCYASLSSPLSLEELHNVYLEKYDGEAFVRVLPKGQLPNISQVRGSNYCDIGLAVDDRTGRVIAIAAIDNLVKGAAGQAVQNMNLMLSLPEDTGLLIPPLFP